MDIEKGKEGERKGMKKEKKKKGGKEGKEGREKERKGEKESTPFGEKQQGCHTLQGSMAQPLGVSTPQLQGRLSHRRKKGP